MKRIMTLVFVFLLSFTVVLSFNHKNLTHAFTSPLTNLSVGDKLQLDGQDFIKTGNSNLLMLSSTLTCPHGKRIAGQWAKCFECPNDSTYDSTNVTCTCTDTSKVYDIDTGTCHVCGIGYTKGDTNSCVIDTTNYSATLGTYYDAANCSDPIAWMDEWTGCSSLATIIKDESITEQELAAKTVCLLDPRDHRSYRVRRFDDDNTAGESSGDKCWTIDSLSFGGDYGELDGCSAYNGQGNFTYTWCGGNLVSGCTAGGSSNATKAQETFSTGYYGHCRAINSTYNNYLYDWVAAMQSTLAYDNSSTTYTSPHQGICPTGWHIPSGTSEYNRLTNRYGTTSSAVANFWIDSTKWAGTLSGYAGSQIGNLTSQGSYGYYWTSTDRSSTKVYDFYFYNSYAGITNSSSKVVGYAVRCVQD